MLSMKLSPKDQTYWNKRGRMDLVVLMDDETSEQDGMDSTKPIWQLNNIMEYVSQLRHW